MNFQTIQKVNKYQKKGIAHTENQDFVCEGENERAKIILIADGVGSCKKSKIGARLVCEHICKIMLTDVEYIFSLSKENIAKLICTNLQIVLKQEADRHGACIYDYSSTLSFVCHNKITKQTMTFVLGDSLVYQIKSNDISLICRPIIHGMNFVNTTTTHGADREVKIEILEPSEASGFLLATDGAWRSFYKDGFISNEFINALENEGIAEFFKNRECKDDCSIVIMEIPRSA